MSINFKLALVLGMILFLVVPAIIIFCSYKNKKVLKILGIIYYIIYCIGLACLVFGKVVVKNGVATLNFDFSYPWFSLKFLWFGKGKTSLIYNLFMLIPVGAFVASQTTQKRFLKTALIPFCMSFIIELFQFILPISRYTEVFDLVINTISGIIGCLIFSVFAWLTKKIRKIED
ncbi:MAG: VanZ family protein [Clostridia bacterium]|nr:VanZ family protein [Clostridia bacterium]